MGGLGGLEGWRWIFVIEGLLTVVCGLLAYLFLAGNLATASFLTPEEQALAVRRLSGNASPDGRFKCVFVSVFISLPRFLLLLLLFRVAFANEMLVCRWKGRRGSSGLKSNEVSSTCKSG